MSFIDAIFVIICISATLVIVLTAGWEPKTERVARAQRRAEIEAAWAELRANERRTS